MTKNIFLIPQFSISVLPASYTQLVLLLLHTYSFMQTRFNLYKIIFALPLFLPLITYTALYHVHFYTFLNSITDNSTIEKYLQSFPLLLSGIFLFSRLIHSPCCLTVSSIISVFTTLLFFKLVLNCTVESTATSCGALFPFTWTLHTNNALPHIPSYIFRSSFFTFWIIKLHHNCKLILIASLIINSYYLSFIFLITALCLFQMSPLSHPFTNSIITTQFVINHPSYSLVCYSCYFTHLFHRWLSHHS